MAWRRPAPAVSPRPDHGASPAQEKNPMAAEITAGKLRNLMTLADDAGRLKMMAIDQRGSLNQSLGKVLGRETRFDEVAQFKQVVTEELAPYSTAVLTDPI